MKRTPLTRRTPLARGDSQLRRTRLNAISAKRRDGIPERQAIREAVLARDGRRCQAAHLFLDVRCYGVLTVHHLQKASQGGGYTMENLVTLCARHNDVIEDRPTIATALGLVQEATRMNRNRRLHFTPEEMERIEHARRIVGLDTITYAELIHHATMQAVDEIEGVNRAVAVARSRAS